MRMRAALVLLVGFAAGAASGKAMHTITDYGAKADGNTPCTEAIQKAIDACAAGGGGVVRVPAGTFLTGSLLLRSRVTVQLDEGATLRGSRDLRDYYGPPLDANGRQTDGKPVFRHLLHGEHLADVTLRGNGTIEGSGDAFRDKTRPRPKVIYLADCRNVLVEHLRLRSAGSWMQHYRLCEGLAIRGIDVFNHVSFNNDGLNIDSCRDVTIDACRVDSDDDGIVLKSLSDRPCRNVKVTGCTVSSHCNALKLGTESGGGFLDITIARCTVFSPKDSQKIYGRQRGLAGIALEIVDGGRMENVAVSDVDIEGVSVPIFLRLGNRARPYVPGAKPGVGTFRNVRLENITARGTSEIGCSIAGLPGHPIEDVTLRNVRLGFDGGGMKADAARTVPEREKDYPESTMFGTLPAWGFYCRHVRGLAFHGLELRTDRPDLRHAMVFDDAQDVTIEGLEATSAEGAAAMLRMTNLRRAVLRGCSPRQKVDVLLAVEGKDSGGICLERCDLRNVTTPVARAPDVPEDAVRPAQPGPGERRP